MRLNSGAMKALITKLVEVTDSCTAIKPLNCTSQHCYQLTLDNYRVNLNSFFFTKVKIRSVLN